MNINLILILCIVLLGGILSATDSPKVRKNYIIFCSFLLILSAALRNLGYGAEGSDTMNYFYMFKNISDFSWQEIWHLFVARYFASGGEEDIGFQVLMKVISYFTNSFHVFTFIAELLFFVPFGIYLYRFSRSMLELIFAFVFYLALVHSHAMTGARQFYAMGFGIMVFLSFYKKQYKYALVSLVLGMTIHMSLLLVVIPCFLSYLSPKHLKQVHLYLWLFFPLVMIMPNQIISFMGGVVGVDRYADYGSNNMVGGTETFIFLLETLSIVCYMGIKKDDIMNMRKIRLLYTMLPCFTFFGPLIYSNGSMIRISIYSYLYLTLLLPFALKNLAKGNGKMMIWLAVLVLSLLVLKGGHGDSYHFYWEVDPEYTW